MLAHQPETHVRINPQRFGLALVVAAILAVAVAPTASAVTIGSITTGSPATLTADTVMTENATGFQITCRHDITIPPSAFTGTSSVSVEAANNVFSGCRDAFSGSCIVRPNGRWTITASTTTAGRIRFDSSVGVGCTRRIGMTYTCSFSMDSGQSVTMTIRSPVAPATTGTLVIDSPNAVIYMVGGGVNCLFGSAGMRGTVTLSETISTENLVVR